MVVCAELIQTLEIHVPKNLQPTRMRGHHFFGQFRQFPAFYKSCRNYDISWGRWLKIMPLRTLCFCSVNSEMKLNNLWWKSISDVVHSQKPKKGEKPAVSKHSSQPSLGTNRLDPLPNSPMHHEALNPSKPLPSFTKKFVKWWRLDCVDQ